MNVKLIAMTPHPEWVAGMAASTCTASPDITRSLRGALASGHDSVVEHVSFTFMIEGVSRVLLAQLTRHRIASFSVQSQRYCGIDGNSVIVPPSIAGDENAKWIFAKARQAVLEAYNELVDIGIPDEDARYIMCQGIGTELVMTMNARELGHFLKLRMCRRAQWEIRALADEIYKIVREECPNIFGHSGPGCVRNRCPQGKRSCGRPRTQQIADLMGDDDDGAV